VCSIYFDKGFFQSWRGTYLENAEPNMSSPNPAALLSVLVGFGALDAAGLLPKSSERSLVRRQLLLPRLWRQRQRRRWAPWLIPAHPDASANMLPMEPLLLVDPAADDPKPLEGDFFTPVEPIPMPKSAKGSLPIFPEEDRL